MEISSMNSTENISLTMEEITALRLRRAEGVANERLTLPERMKIGAMACSSEKGISSPASYPNSRAWCEENFTN